MSKEPRSGMIAWRDLTVENAEQVRDFYEAVVGWKVNPVDMGDYSDYSMVAASGEDVAGVCHARGKNADLPPQWLIYVVVESVDDSARSCTALGGEIVTGPRAMGDGKLCVVRDPAGAVIALYQPPREG